MSRLSEVALGLALAFAVYAVAHLASAAFHDSSSDARRAAEAALHAVVLERDSLKRVIGAQRASYAADSVGWQEERAGLQDAAARTRSQARRDGLRIGDSIRAEASQLADSAVATRIVQLVDSMEIAHEIERAEVDSLHAAEIATHEAEEAALHVRIDTLEDALATAIESEKLHGPIEDALRRENAALRRSRKIGYIIGGLGLAYGVSKG